MAGQAISADVCAKMVESATKACQPMVLVPPEPVNKTADSLAALSTAFTYGSILLAVIALLGALTWGFLVKIWAEREARAEAIKVAKECADAYINKWLAEEAPGIIRARVDLIHDPTLGSGDDDIAADDLGEGAG